MMVSGELQFDDKAGERAETRAESDVRRKQSHGCCGRTDGNEERGQEGLTLPRSLPLCCRGNVSPGARSADCEAFVLIHVPRAVK